MVLGTASADTVSFELPQVSPPPFAHHTRRRSTLRFLDCGLNPRAPRSPPPCGFGSRRTLKGRFAAAVRFGFVWSLLRSLTRHSCIRYLRRSVGTACAKLHYGLVASLLSSAPFGRTRACTLLLRSPFRLAPSGPPSLPRPCRLPLEPPFHLSASVRLALPPASTPSPELPHRLSTMLRLALPRTRSCAMHPASSSWLVPCGPLHSTRQNPHRHVPACAFPLWRVLASSFHACALPALTRFRLPFHELSRAPTPFRLAPSSRQERSRTLGLSSGTRPLLPLPRFRASGSAWPARSTTFRRRPSQHPAHHARLLRTPLRRLFNRRWEKTSAHGFLVALASNASTALSRARSHAPLLRAARFFGPSDSSNSPGPLTRTLWV